MKFVIIISSLLVAVSCSSPSPSSEPAKNFEGKLSFVPLENVRLCFDRYAEIQNSTLKKDSIMNIYKGFGFINQFGLTIKISNADLKEFKSFIKSNLNQLILNRNHEMIWKDENDSSRLVLINKNKMLDASSLVHNLEAENNSTTITFSPAAKKVISAFSMKYLSMPIAIIHNGEVISIAKSFGRLKNNQMKF